MMLHGDEAHRFLRTHYTQNKAIADLTAKLAGYGLLDVKICETWMRINGYSKQDLYPFVSTVPYGKAELDRLVEKEDYAEYDVDL